MPIASMRDRRYLSYVRKSVAEKKKKTATHLYKIITRYKEHRHLSAHILFFENNVY